MDICGHLMKECRETKKFILPEPAMKIEEEVFDQVDFTEEDNEINLFRCKKQQFYDAQICRHLCSKTLVLDTKQTNLQSHCQSICLDLSRASDGAGEICPYEKYCINGCPCLHFNCEKTSSDQKMTPVFDLHNSQVVNITEIEGKFISFFFIFYHQRDMKLP